MAEKKQPLSYYLLAGFFGLFVLFLYGPMSAIFLLSLQGPEGNGTKISGNGDESSSLQLVTQLVSRLLH